MHYLKIKRLQGSVYISVQVFFMQSKKPAFTYDTLPKTFSATFCLLSATFCNKQSMRLLHRGSQRSLKNRKGKENEKTDIEFLSRP